jgi:hypothetical protein
MILTKASEVCRKRHQVNRYAQSRDYETIKSLAQQYSLIRGCTSPPCDDSHSMESQLAISVANVVTPLFPMNLVEG